MPNKISLPPNMPKEHFDKLFRAFRQELINRSRKTIEIPGATPILEIALKERNFKTKWKDKSTLLVQNLTPKNEKRLKEFLNYLEDKYNG